MAPNVWWDLGGLLSLPQLPYTLPKLAMLEPLLGLTLSVALIPEKLEEEKRAALPPELMSRYPLEHVFPTMGEPFSA